MLEGCCIDEECEDHQELGLTEKKNVYVKSISKALFNNKRDASKQFK